MILNTKRTGGGRELTALPMASYAAALFSTCYSALDGIYDHNGYAARVCGPARTDRLTPSLSRVPG